MLSACALKPAWTLQTRWFGGMELLWEFGEGAGGLQLRALSHIDSTPLLSSCRFLQPSEFHIAELPHEPGAHGHPVPAPVHWAGHWLLSGLSRPAALAHQHPELAHQWHGPPLLRHQLPHGPTLDVRPLHAQPGLWHQQPAGKGSSGGSAAALGLQEPPLGVPRPGRHQREPKSSSLRGKASWRCPKPAAFGGLPWVGYEGAARLERGHPSPLSPRLGWKGSSGHTWVSWGLLEL